MKSPVEPLVRSGPYVGQNLAQMDVAVQVDKCCQCSEQVTTIEYIVRMFVHVARLMFV